MPCDSANLAADPEETNYVLSKKTVKRLLLACRLAWAGTILGIAAITISLCCCAFR